MNNLLMEVENEIAVVTINRPKSLNALNSETLAELDACFSEISESSQWECTSNMVLSMSSCRNGCCANRSFMRGRSRGRNTLNGN